MELYNSILRLGAEGATPNHVHIGLFVFSLRLQFIVRLHPGKFGLEAM